MSLETFIAERKKLIEGKVPLSTLKLHASRENSFVDCLACDHIKYLGENKFCCNLSKYAIPERVVPLGCDEGTEDDIPF